MPGTLPRPDTPDPTAGASPDADADPRDWRALHRDAMVVDAHNDLLMAVAHRPPEAWGRYFREQWLPALRAGGVDLQILPVFVDQHHSSESALRQTLLMIECAHRLAADSPGVRLCRNGLQIRDAINSGSIALLLALEGMPGVGGDPVLLSTMARLGVRVASLTHTGRAAFADGSAEEAAGSRLTGDGVHAVRVLEEVGMLLDVSHLAATGVEHALEIARKPVLATHSAARALCDHHRNLSDDLLRGIADTGGVVGVNCYPEFLHPTDRRRQRLIDHIEHIAEVAGADHIGLGPDFLQRTVRDLPGPWSDRPWSTVDGLGDSADLPVLTRDLIARGWSTSSIRKVLGGNFLRVLDEHLVGQAPS